MRQANAKNERLKGEDMKIRCSRNEMKEILKQKINDCYNGKATWEEYRALDFDIIPLDFSSFPEIKEETREYIDAVFDEETTDKNGNYMLRGFIGDSLKRWYRDKEKLNINYAPCGFYYSGFGFNDSEMLIYTWCEGDTTLTIFSDRTKYDAERKATEIWFNEN